MTDIDPELESARSRVSELERSIETISDTVDHLFGFALGEIDSETDYVCDRLQLLSEHFTALINSRDQLADDLKNRPRKVIGKQQLEITFKSGSTVSVDVDKAVYTRSPLGGTLEWTTPENWTSKILKVELDEVAAVIVREN